MPKFDFNEEGGTILQRELDEFDEHLMSITDRIYQILDRLEAGYSSLLVKIVRIEKKLERVEGKPGTEIAKEGIP